MRALAYITLKPTLGACRMAHSRDWLEMAGKTLTMDSAALSLWGPMQSCNGHGPMQLCLQPQALHVKSQSLTAVNLAFLMSMSADMSCGLLTCLEHPMTARLIVGAANGASRATSPGVETVMLISVR